MGKSVIPKGKVKVSFCVPIDLLEQLKERAEIESWSQTTAFTEAIKCLLNNR